MEPVDLNYALAAIALIGCSGFVSGSETAFFSLESGQLNRFRLSPSRTKRQISQLMDEADGLLLTILILNNIINVSYFAMISAWAGSQVGGVSSAAGTGIALGGLAGLILLGEILPKVVASSSAPAIATLTCWPLQAFIGVLAPISRPLMRRLSDSQATSTTGMVSADELKVVIEQTHEHGVVSELIHDRMMDVIDLSETPVLRVMTHRLDCPQIGVDDDPQRTIEALRQQPGPFVIVSDDSDECVGLLSAQDFLKGGRPAKRMRKPLFVPGNANLAQALTLFKKHRHSAAVVVDEYGGTLGLLTLAHIGNELLGPGASVDLPELPAPRQIAEDVWRVPGRLPIEGWEPLLEAEDITDCTTIGGFVTKMLGAIPQAGDRMLYGNLLFRIDQVDGGRIGTITIQKLEPQLARRMSREFKGKR